MSTVYIAKTTVFLKTFGIFSQFIIKTLSSRQINAVIPSLSRDLLNTFFLSVKPNRLNIAYKVGTLRSFEELSKSSIWYTTPMQQRSKSRFICDWQSATAASLRMTQSESVSFVLFQVAVYTHIGSWDGEDIVTAVHAYSVQYASLKGP